MAYLKGEVLIDEKETITQLAGDSIL